MNYCKDYCEEKGISTSKLNAAQRTLYHIAENMKIAKSIHEEGYKHFQMAIKALEQETILDKVKEEVEQTRKIYLDMNDIDWLNGCDYVLAVIDKYKAESEDK